MNRDIGALGELSKLTVSFQLDKLRSFYIEPTFIFRKGGGGVYSLLRILQINFEQNMFKEVRGEGGGRLLKFITTILQRNIQFGSAIDRKQTCINEEIEIMQKYS